MRYEEIDTPAVVIHEDIMRENVKRMQDFCEKNGYRLRPHIKSHKIPEIAHLQMDQGAAGITCQKLGEAEVMIDHGIKDILIYYNIIGSKKLERLSGLCQKAKIALAIDSLDVAREISKALVNSRGEAGILIDCNTGYDRTGVNGPEEALELAKQLMALPQLHFLGLATFPFPSGARDWFASAARLFADAGIPIQTISAGGSGFPTLSNEPIPLVTELRTGTYVFNDRTCVLNGWASFDQCALRVLTTVVSVTNDIVIVDAGSKTLTSDIRKGMTGYGYIMEFPEAEIFQFSEEHGHVDVSRCSQKPKLGDVLTVIPNHACGTMNLHDEVLRLGNDEIVGRWTVAARGKVR
ncbi:alanine racemase [Ferviditalea candida]|uniref:Alanine racemase n=1 Tax=Ferviditalea candida TaxID=3108399 RepID=A0ABU5ZKV9_9BACL|nr:alanine racemase [Paenibacillaceae bacterium T2]